MSDSGVFDAVRDGYDAVYDALPRSATFNRLWRTNAYRDEFPLELAHIGFLTTGEGQRLLDLLRIHEGDALVDVACGAGGPGLWVAGQTGASLVGVDASRAGLVAARERAGVVGLEHRARFELGTFEQTGLPGESADAVMSIEALQYAPDKRAAMTELFRIMRPGARLGFVCFEVEPAKVEGLPVFGVDPIPDYGPLLDAAGFTVEAYEETSGWEERVYATFTAVVDAAEVIAAEMGEQAAAGLIAEATLTVEVKPYPRRVLAVARRPA